MKIVTIAEMFIFKWRLLSSLLKLTYFVFSQSSHQTQLHCKGNNVRNLSDTNASLFKPGLAGQRWITRGDLEPNEHRVSRCLWRHCHFLVTETNMAEYVSYCKKREVHIDKSTVSISRRIYFCHEKTTMMSKTSENTIFLRFYYTQPYLMLSVPVSIWE